MNTLLFKPKKIKLSKLKNRIQKLFKLLDKEGSLVRESLINKDFESVSFYLHNEKSTSKALRKLLGLEKKIINSQFLKNVQ